jgi:hypothetical protein
MNNAGAVCKAFFIVVLGVFGCRSLCATTWYVRPDGGTRYSANQTSGQCDGKTDAAYPGKGTNKHCAFKDVRYLWTDTSYCIDNGPTSKCWRWVGAGGDTYILRGSIADGVSYRIGQSGPEAHDYFGLAGNPYGAGMPAPPSGTEAQPTRILGGGYENCSAQAARTQLHGGYGVGSVIDMSGASYVDLACLDITDFSTCGRSAQTDNCHSNFPLSDYATRGVQWSNTSTHDTLTNIRVHGLASVGMAGPTGDGVVMDHIDIIGNAGAGWNADSGDKTTGTGTLLVTNFNISWNGCAEEYPIVDPLPYKDCTDDNVGGYGDGFGTATIASNPGWKAHFDHGIVSYNTQDGLDALHLTGAGSSMTVTNTLAYGNMGQQLKVGGTSGTIQHDVIFTNCNAMRQKIPGTPAGYNTRLSDFCRAADAGNVLMVGDGSTAVFSDNVIYSASSTGVEVDVGDKCVTGTCLIKQENNIFIGFKNDVADGYPQGSPVTNEYSNPFYIAEASKAYTNPGSRFDHNTTFHANANWRCPAVRLHETNAHCGDPHLTDESWHVYGYGNVTPLSGASVKTSDRGGQNSGGPKRIALASLGLAFLTTTGWVGWRRRKARSRLGQRDRSL